MQSSHEASEKSLERVRRDADYIIGSRKMKVFAISRRKHSLRCSLQRRGDEILARARNELASSKADVIKTNYNSGPEGRYIC